jgi:hypothetical protein
MYQDMSLEISESTGQHQHRFRSNALCFDEFAKSNRQTVLICFNIFEFAALL